MILFLSLHVPAVLDINILKLSCLVLHYLVFFSCQSPCVQKRFEAGTKNFVSIKNMTKRRNRVIFKNRLTKSADMESNRLFLVNNIIGEIYCCLMNEKQLRLALVGYNLALVDYHSKVLENKFV